MHEPGRSARVPSPRQIARVSRRLLPLPRRVTRSINCRRSWSRSSACSSA